MANTRRQIVRAGLYRARVHGTDTRTQRACRRELCRRRFCCRLCLWKHAQCTGQNMRGWVVCGSRGVLLCSIGWQSVRVSLLSCTQLLDHRCSPHMCSSAVLLGTVLVHTLLVVCLRLLQPYDPGRAMRYLVCCGSEQASMPRDGPRPNARQETPFAWRIAQ